MGANRDFVVVGLLAGAAVLLVLATLVRVPYPILLVLGGLVVGFVPGVPSSCSSPSPASLLGRVLHLAARPAA